MIAAKMEAGQQRQYRADLDAVRPVRVREGHRAVAQLFVFGTWLPHRDRAEPFADSHRAHSIKIGPTLSLLTCFHFGGYHHEHHLSPGTPWWGLPARRRATVEKVAGRQLARDRT